jgi:hypothetical protein
MKIVKINLWNQGIIFIQDALIRNFNKHSFIDALSATSLHNSPRYIIVLAYNTTKQKWPKNKENIFLKQFQFPQFVNKTVFTRFQQFYHFYSLEIHLYTQLDKTLWLFLFGKTTASFSTKICSSVTGTKRKAILFLSGGE